MATKEEIYDEHIEPLMRQILETCKQHKIAMIADFALDAVDLHCTSALLGPEYEPSDTQLSALRFLQPGKSEAVAMVEETMPDGRVRLSITRIS